jgi:ferrous iron transport protein B
VGKSTVFNALTGGRQRVGNWSGTTVQVAAGEWRTAAGPIAVVDLPGTYSLQPTSPADELVRDLLVDRPEGGPDLVVAIVDAANLAQNLYLLAQVLDTGTPVVVGLTMMDIAGRRGLRVDTRALSARLGVPVIALRSRSGDGVDRLGAAVSRTLPASAVGARPGTGDDPADRHAWARRVAAACVHRHDPDRATRSDQVDRVLTSRWLGLPAFLLILGGVLAAAVWVAAPLQDVLAGLLDGPVATGTRWLLAQVRLDHTWVAGLAVDGVVSGVGQLLTFVPLMALMFALLAVLEDSGYLARAAFVADRLLRMLGLPGHAFLPLVVGFGCNVPAIAATRTLTHARDRVLVSLLVPYTTCSARLAVYALLASSFFGRYAGIVVLAMYALSVLLVVLVGLGLRRTALRTGEREALVLELPPYRLPSLRIVAAQTAHRLAAFLRKAGGIIVLAVAVVWLLMTIPIGANEGAGDGTAFAVVSRAAAPVFAPAGFADWRATGALVTGLAAKEAVVTTFAQTHGPGPLDEQLRATFDASSGGHATAAALAFLVFVLAYPPCVATVATQRAEIGWRWTGLGLGVQLAVAWSLATLTFQVGRLLAG